MDPFITPIVAGSVLKGIGMANSASLQKRAQRDLDKLTATPRPRYGITPEIRKQYEQALGEASTRRGYGGATVSSFRKRLGQTLGTKGRIASSMGGNPRAVNAVLAGQEADALNQFYAGEEGFANANRLGAIGRAGNYANLYQRINDANTQADLNYRLMLEQALGNTIRSQRDFRMGTLNSIGNDLITGGFYGLGGGKTVPIEEEISMTGGPGVTPSIMNPNVPQPPANWGRGSKINTKRLGK